MLCQGKLTDYNEVDAIGHLLLWLADSYREHEVIRLLTNITTNAGTAILLMITTKRVILLETVQLPHPLVVFEVLI